MKFQFCALGFSQRAHNSIQGLIHRPSANDRKEVSKGVLLLANDWINPTEEMLVEVNKKWLNVHNIHKEQARDAAANELLGKKYETLRNQTALSTCVLYDNKVIYWPAFQDFRSRIYRIGHLNIQQNPFIRKKFSSVS